MSFYRGKLKGSHKVKGAGAIFMGGVDHSAILSELPTYFNRFPKSSMI